MDLNQFTCVFDHGDRADPTQSRCVAQTTVGLDWSVLCPQSTTESNFYVFRFAFTTDTVIERGPKEKKGKINGVWTKLRT